MAPLASETLPFTATVLHDVLSAGMHTMPSADTVSAPMVRRALDGDSTGNRTFSAQDGIGIHRHGTRTVVPSVDNQFAAVHRGISLVDIRSGETPDARALLDDVGGAVIFGGSAAGTVVDNPGKGLVGSRTADMPCHHMSCRVLA